MLQEVVNIVKSVRSERRNSAKLQYAHKTSIEGFLVLLRWHLLLEKIHHHAAKLLTCRADNSSLLFSHQIK